MSGLDIGSRRDHPAATAAQVTLGWDAIHDLDRVRRGPPAVAHVGLVIGVGAVVEGVPGGLADAEVGGVHVRPG